MNALLVGATTAAAAHRPVAVAVAVALVVQHGSNEYHVLTELAKFGERISMANLSICVAPGEDTESRSSKECVIKIFTLLQHHQTSPGVTLSHVACGWGWPFGEFMLFRLHFGEQVH